MFLENSRYHKVDTVVTRTRDGRSVCALKLRQLPARTGEPYTVKGGDKLDVLAYEQYADGTKFWHIADANTALEASKLVAETGAVLIKPKS
jgi:hypothetical protein